TPPLPLRDVPATSFNGSLTARRTFVSTALPLDQIGLVRRTFGVTLNDVLLAVVAGTLRARLERRGERPARPLVAEVPVATDPSPARRLGGQPALQHLHLALHRRRRSGRSLACDPRRDDVGEVPSRRAGRGSLRGMDAVRASQALLVVDASLCAASRGEPPSTAGERDRFLRSGPARR